MEEKAGQVFYKKSITLGPKMAAPICTLELEAAGRLARLEHQRGRRREPGGSSPTGQGGEASELRGGARASPRHPPQGLAITAHR